MIILKKIRKKLSIALSIALSVGTFFTTKPINAYESDMSNDFYEKCGKLIQENWNENNDAEDDSVNKEFQTMRLILKIRNTNIDLDKYKPKDIIKHNNTVVLQFDTIEKTKDAYEDLKSSKDIEYVEIDKVVEINSKLGKIIDNISSKNSSSSDNLDSYIAYNSGGVEKIKANKYSTYLFDKGKNSNLTVAVVDTGVDYKMDIQFKESRVMVFYTYVPRYMERTQKKSAYHNNEINYNETSRTGIIQIKPFLINGIDVTYKVYLKNKEINSVFNQFFFN